MIKVLSTPVRWLLRFPLVQLAVVIFLILVMQAADDRTALGEAFGALDRLVDSSIGAVSALFTVKSFTKSWLTFGFMIGYVYLACWLIFSIARIGVRLLVDFVGRQNILWLRSTIARPRHWSISRLVAWKRFGLLRFHSPYGKRPAPGREITSPRIHRCFSACCAGLLPIWAPFCFWRYCYRCSLPCLRLVGLRMS
jgi:hypothetical protein